jgi:hypothetical protein
MNFIAHRTTSKRFNPSLNRLEERALLSTFGRGKVDLSITHLSSTSRSLNFTSNTFHQINESIAGIAQMIVSNPNNSGIVQAQLQTLVSRIPYGQANLLNELQTDLDTFNQGSVSVSTVEATTSLTTLYNDVLGRAPTASEMSSGITALQSNTSIQQMTTTLATSTEFLNKNTTVGASDSDNHRQFVTALYGNVLLRSPDQSGLDFWVSGLDSGHLTSNSVATSFINSTESTTSPTTVLQAAALPAGSVPVYYFGSAVPGGPITGNFVGTSKLAQVENLLQRDILAYLGNNIGTSFNILKSGVKFPSDNLLSYNGKV